MINQLAFEEWFDREILGLPEHKIRKYVLDKYYELSFLAGRSMGKPISNLYVLQNQIEQIQQEAKNTETDSLEQTLLKKR